MDPGAQILWENVLSTVDVAIRILGRALLSKEGREFVCTLGPRDAGLCLELLDRGLANCPLDGGSKKTFLLALIALAGQRGRFPSSFAIPDQVELSDKILASSGFADIKSGVYDNRPVAVKVLRHSSRSDIENIRKRFCKEVVLWGSLSHSNILKLLGVSGNINSRNFSTVTDLMAHGNIMQYIKTNRANRLELLHGVAQGLGHIHDADFAYGDLKGENILINNDVPPRACLSDFGFTTIVRNPNRSLSVHAAAEDGTFSFTAPELLAPAKFGLGSSIPTREADVFAFGLLAFQVLTGKPPFDYATIHECTDAIVEGVRPGKPENAEAIGFSAALWELLSACWGEDRTLRPRIHAITDVVRDAADRWNSLMLPYGPHSDQDPSPGRSDEVPDQNSGRTGKNSSPTHMKGETESVRAPAASTCPTSPPETIAKNHQRLWDDVTNATDEGKAVRTLAEILVDKEGRDYISRLDRRDAELCIEILDRGIAVHNIKPIEKQTFFVTLRRLTGHHGRLPDSMTITEKIEVEDEILATGGFADVRCGRYMGHLVAVKTLKVKDQDDLLKIRMHFCKEVVLWSALSHPNVLKLTGVQGDMEKGQFVTVSEWMVHGTIVEYIKNNHTNRLELLHGAAQGLKYLHGANLVHGNIKGANIFVTNDTPPRACLADFGFMAMVLDPLAPMSCSVQLEGGTLTFMPPELLQPSKFGMKHSLPTTEADIYAFGLVIFQVLVGEIPFRGVRQAEMAWSVLQGSRPKKPENASSIGFSDSLWSFVQRCWDGDMKLRPKVGEVVMHLRREAANWHGLMPPCAPAENVALISEEPMSDTMEHCPIFPSFSEVGLESPTKSQATPGLLISPSTPSTQSSEQPQKEPQEVVTKPSKEPRDNLHVVGAHSHLNVSNWRDDPPPSQPLQKKRKGFKYFKSKLRELSGFSR